jgi:biotin-(acetyl-CoA carboxylase) ligase
MATIDQPWTDLTRVMASPPSRNALCAVIIDGLLDASEAFAAHGVDGILARWRRFDGLSDRLVEVRSGESRVTGTYRGVAGSGAALIETPDGIAEHFAGEVSLRATVP